MTGFRKLRDALRKRLDRLPKRPPPRVSRVSDELRLIAERLKAHPVLDARTDDQILGYDEHGLPR